MFLAPGKGKTAITLAAIKVLLNEGMIRGALVIAPLSVVYDVWPREQLKWKDFHGLSMAVLHGPNKEERLQEPADIYVINPEGLPLLVEKVKRKSLNKRTGKYREVVDYRVRKDLVKELPFDMLVIDESTKFKNYNNDRFKRMRVLLPHFRRRAILTGTPMPRSVENLFSQIYMVDEGRALGRYITHFRNRWFNSTGFGGYTYVPKEGAFEEIMEVISPYTIRVGDDSKGPKQVDNPIMVTLPHKAQQVYDMVEQELFAFLADGGSVTAKTAAVARGKLHQLAGGGVYVDPVLGEGDLKKRWTEVHDAKAQRLADLIDELQGQPLLVAYWYAHEVPRIAKALGVSVKELPRLDRSTKPKQKAQVIDQWNRGELSYVLVHPSTVAHGLNLQEVPGAVCWYSLTDDFELYDQLIRRLKRTGQKAKEVTNHLLIAEGTVDELMAEGLLSKEGRQLSFLDRLEQVAKTYQQGRQVSK